MGGVLDDGYDALEFFGGDFSGAIYYLSVSFLVLSYVVVVGRAMYRLVRSTSAFLQTRLE